MTIGDGRMPIFRSALWLATFGGFACLPIVGLAAQPGASLQEAAKDAGFLLGVDKATWAGYNRCARTFPDRAERFTKLRDQVDRANGQIAMLAKEKWLAAIEVEYGKGKRLETEGKLDEILLKDLTQLTARQTQSELDNSCNSLLNTNPETFFLLLKYPEKVEAMLQYRIGYPWSLPICEFRVTFPHQPRVSTISEGNSVTLKAETREGFGPPYISATCQNIRSSHENLVRRLEASGNRQLTDMGVRDLRWTQEESPIAQRLKAQGDLKRDGIAITMEKSFWIGQTSLLEITISEPSADYPSLETVQFKEWIERK